ncbi:MAG: glycosyltransferase family 2 protein [Muribaculaceae bacterium]|nr:glycosyltransferase family 2 protein [Muribaculaceae bacterium]
MRSSIAVVIPVFNREKLVIRALESAVGQTLLPAEIIVVDNASSDESYANVEKWIAEHQTIDVPMRLIKETHPGAAAARNAGLREVTAEYVCFLDSDDMLAPELMSEASKEIAANGRLCDLICWQTAEVCTTGQKKRKAFHDDMFKSQIYQSRICTQTFAVRTKFLRDIGGWNASLRCWDDWELGVRLLVHNPRLRQVDKVLSIIYPQRISITGENHYSKAGEWEKAIDAAEADVEGMPDEKKLRGMINYRRLNLAALYKREGRSDLAEPLRQKALTHPSVNRSRRLMLNLIYHYTARGGRGGYLMYEAIRDKRIRDK